MFQDPPPCVMNPRPAPHEVVMQYVEFRDAIRDYLKSHRAGATWSEIRLRLRLPYKIPCPTWVARLETDIGLTRSAGSPSKVWKLRNSRSRGPH